MGNTAYSDLEHEVVLFWESVNFDFRNTHKGYGNKEYKSEHFIKINKNGAKTQRT